MGGGDTYYFISPWDCLASPPHKFLACWRAHHRSPAQSGPGGLEGMLEKKHFPLNLDFLNGYDTEEFFGDLKHEWTKYPHTSTALFFP